MATLGEVANQVAADSVCADYRSCKAANTIRRQDWDLHRFTEYLHEVGVTTYGNHVPILPGTIDHGRMTDPPTLATEPRAWAGLTWGLVEGFNRWQLGRGFAVGSVNVRLSTVKTYAKLAAKAGTIDAGELALIRNVAGYSRPEKKRIDAQRDDAGVFTRVGVKKPNPVLISRDQAARLKDQPNTPQGRRDRLIMCLLIDHGLRVSEVAALTVGAFDLGRREFLFYRPKVDKEQTHELTDESFEAARDYLGQDAPEASGDSLLRGSRKGGRLTDAGMTTQSINLRVRTLGDAAGVDGLSPHDLRHYWATTAARNKTPIDRLQDAGGWASPAIPLTRYIEPAKIANEGVNLGEGTRRND
jgi:integrase